MIIHVIVKYDSEDNFQVKESVNEKVLIIPSWNSTESTNNVSHDISTLLKRRSLRPCEQMIDFGNIGFASYIIDQLVPRESVGYYNWSRYIKIYVPVQSVTIWESAKKEIEQLLSFLSGDKWELIFRDRNNHYSNFTRDESGITKVSLFSGGLDSFIGAIDLLEEGEKIAFASHHKMGGSAGEASTQRQLIDDLKSNYSQDLISDFLFYVQPHKSQFPFNGENSQRARSILFITLGLLVANSVGENTTLVIPENGLISLNVPLTKTRYGTFSTKTTHPNFLHKLRNVLSLIGVENKITNPYKFKTKGEMLEESRNIDLAKSLANRTISCSKAGYHIQRQGREEVNCGYCIPCLIRRASMSRNEIDSFSGNYVMDIKNSDIGSDIKPFRVGWSRLTLEPDKKLFHILKSGPIPYTEEDLRKYIGVYERGMKEVNDFLSAN